VFWCILAWLPAACLPYVHVLSACSPSGHLCLLCFSVYIQRHLYGCKAGSLRYLKNLQCFEVAQELTPETRQKALT